ncbi:MAG: hypothetical protein AAFW69_11440 [Pseudomonadota bacterium]
MKILATTAAALVLSASMASACMFSMGYERVAEAPPPAPVTPVYGIS